MRKRTITTLTAPVCKQLERYPLKYSSARCGFASRSSLSQQAAQASATDDVERTNAVESQAQDGFRNRRVRERGAGLEQRGPSRFLTSTTNVRFLGSTAQVSLRSSDKEHPFASTSSKATWSPRRRGRDVSVIADSNIKIEDNKIYALERSKAGTLRWSEVSGRWLRDNCACKECRHPDTAQRKINVLSGGIDCSILSVDRIDSGTRAVVKFGDGHESTFKCSAIADKNWPQTVHLRQGELTKPYLWKAKIAGSPPIVTYDAVLSSGGGMSKLLQKVNGYGFCFVDHVPPTPEATERVLQSIGPIRNTHYGGFYDFTSDLSSKDTAYTAEALEPHTDTTYFTEPIGLQALHLLSHTDGTGGLSSLVDGFAAAAALFDSDIEAYLVLSKVRVYAHASGNEGISIQSNDGYPTFTHDSLMGHLTQVRWNNADRADLKRLPWTLVDEWYDAASKFDKLLQSQKNQYWFQLKPGRMLLFDNWRVLHGRSAFTGKRRMCGGYINRDDWISKLRMTTLSKDELEASTVCG